jgi:hypothetical protein
LVFLITPLFLIATSSCAQLLTNKKDFTRQDTLRGSLNPYRTGWDVMRYDISVTPDYTDRSIKGAVNLLYNDLSGGHTMQIDLQEPLIIDSIIQNKKPSFFQERRRSLLGFCW